MDTPPECRRCESIGVLTEEYLADLTLRGHSPKSVQTFRVALAVLKGFLATRKKNRLQDISCSLLVAFRLALIRRSLAPASLALYLRTVRGFFAWLERRQVIFRSPARDWVIPRAPRRLLAVPSEAEVSWLLAQPDTTTIRGLRDRAFLELAYSTGLRRAELMALRRENLDFESDTVRVVGKGQRERVVPMGGEAKRWLNEYLVRSRPRLVHGSDPGRLWLNQQGGVLGYFGGQQIIAKHVQAARFNRITLHSLRRACASHMLQRGAHPMQLRELLGHATARSLGQYLGLTIRDLRRTHARSKPGR